MNTQNIDVGSVTSTTKEQQISSKQVFDYLLSVYSRLYSLQYYNGFDQKVYASSYAFNSEPAFSVLMSAVSEYSICLDNISYLNISPQQSVIPVHDVFKQQHQQFLLSVKYIEGKIGFNQSVGSIFEILISKEIGKPDKIPYSVNVPSLIVLFKNDKLFQHVSQIILSDVLIYGFETALQQDPMPQQYVHSLTAKEIYFSDYSVSDTKWYHKLLKKFI